MHSFNTFWISSVVHQSFTMLLNSHFNPSIARTKAQPRRPANASAYAAGGEDDDGESSISTISLPSQGKYITSTSNPFVKHCVKLRTSSSYRHSHGLVLVVGSTPIREICTFQQSEEDKTAKIDCLFLLDNAEIPEGLDHQSISCVHVNTLVMKKLSGVQSTESIDAIALMRTPSTFHKVDDDKEEADLHRWFPSLHRILVLDRIQDPGNLGTLLRSAMAFKWGGVFLLPGCCDPFNEKAIRASRGASFQLPIVSGSWIHLEALTYELNMKILAGHPENSREMKSVSWLSPGFADSLVETPLCLILGSEGGGLSDKTRQEAELVSIPMVGEFESLNVSVAGGILLYMLQPKNLRFA